jgi:hypothetical protein
LIERYIVADPIASRHIGDIRLADSVAFSDRLLTKYGNTATVRLIIGAYKWVFARAHKLGLIEQDPAAGLDLPHPVGRAGSIYSETELARLFPKSVWASRDFSPWKGPEDYTAFCLCASTGMRRGEIKALDWSAVHLENAGREYVDIRASLSDTGKIEKPKSGRSRSCPICDAVLWRDRRCVTALSMREKITGTTRLHMLYLRGDTDPVDPPEVSGPEGLTERAYPPPVGRDRGSGTRIRRRLAGGPSDGHLTKYDYPWGA